MDCRTSLSQQETRIPYGYVQVRSRLPTCQLPDPCSRSPARLRCQSMGVLAAADLEAGRFIIRRARSRNGPWVCCSKPLPDDTVNSVAKHHCNSIGWITLFLGGYPSSHNSGCTKRPCPFAAHGSGETGLVTMCSRIWRYTSGWSNGTARAWFLVSGSALSSTLSARG